MQFVSWDKSHSGGRRRKHYRSWSSGAPGSSRSWMDVAGPRSGSFHEDKAQTTFFSGVTSKTCTVPAHSCVLLFPAHQLQLTVLPLASRLAVWVLKSLISGTSAWVSSQ